MKNTFNVLGVAGSTRQSSYSTRALKIALEHAKKHDAEVRLLELSRTVLPLYDPSAPASKEVERAAEAIAWADAFILASPDYHGSMSGALKNFLDHMRRASQLWIRCARLCASAMDGACPMEYR
jgi:NAD(P)H-dependent FMN reductase